MILLDATHWQINSVDGTIHETITLANGATVDASDYVFEPSGHVLAALGNPFERGVPPQPQTYWEKAKPCSMPSAKRTLAWPPESR